jgi:hypothetical protein
MITLMDNDVSEIEHAASDLEDGAFHITEDGGTDTTLRDDNGFVLIAIDVDDEVRVAIDELL